MGSSTFKVAFNTPQAILSLHSNILPHVNDFLVGVSTRLKLHAQNPSTIF